MSARLTYAVAALALGSATSRSLPRSISTNEGWSSRLPSGPVGSRQMDREG
jgi:hypothetical protein